MRLFKTYRDGHAISFMRLVKLWLLLGMRDRMLCLAKRKYGCPTQFPNMCNRRQIRNLRSAIAKGFLCRRAYMLRHAEHNAMKNIKSNFSKSS